MNDYLLCKLKLIDQFIIMIIKWISLFCETSNKNNAAKFHPRWAQTIFIISRMPL